MAVRHLFFIDEVFWVKNDWLREFLKLYREQIAVPFTANFRFGGLQEEDIRLLAEAGATGLAVATETADEEQRRDLLNKPVKNRHILQVCEWLHKYRIPFASSVFFGLPGDTGRTILPDWVSFAALHRPTCGPHSSSPIRVCRWSVTKRWRR